MMMMMMRCRSCEIPYGEKTVRVPHATAMPRIRRAPLVGLSTASAPAGSSDGECPGFRMRCVGFLAMGLREDVERDGAARQRVAATT
jgi:hypothetical protein